MDRFSVKALAELAGVSVRTLHHYDKIGLLKPAIREESRYRYYGRAEALRLQQILLYKELDFPLSQIAEILDAPEFDTLQALERHKMELQKRKDRLVQLLQTIDHTIVQLKDKSTPMDYEEMYKGFPREQAAAYRREAAEHWGEETMAGSEKCAQAMGKDAWQALLRKGEELNEALTRHLHLSPDDTMVQELIKQHYDMTGQHFAVTPEIYRNLGAMYVEDECFKAYYDKYHPRLAAFLCDAISVFCDRQQTS
jgi:DNA-binding transcriptional MerR regulator